MGCKQKHLSRSVVALPLAVALQLLSTATGPADAQSVGLTYDSERGRLSASIETMPADDLLRQIGKVAGIGVRVRGEVGEVPAQAFTDLPLDEAILRLFRSTDRGLSIFYETLSGDGERVAEVRLSARAPAGPKVTKAVSVDEAKVPLNEDAGQAQVALPPLLPPPPPASFR